MGMNFISAKASVLYTHAPGAISTLVAAKITARNLSSRGQMLSKDCPNNTSAFLEHD
jgi:hypothetical protein